MIRRWMEITFVLILVFLVLSRSRGFSTVVSSLASAYVEAGMMLQGR